MECITIYSAILTILLGAFLGYFAGVKKQQYSVTSLFIERYMLAKEELCEKISKLACLDVRDEYDKEFIKTTSKEIYQLYHKYYDYYPKEVRAEINCLYACLTRKNNKLYKSVEENGRRIIRPVKNYEIAKFVDKVFFYDNLKHFHIKVLLSKKPRVRQTAAVSYQARRVLVSIKENDLTRNAIKKVGLLKKYK